MKIHTNLRIVIDDLENIVSLLKTIPHSRAHTALSGMPNNAKVYVDEFNRLCILLNNEWFGIPLNNFPHIAGLEVDLAPYMGG